MPRTYKRKTEPKYTKEDLQKSLCQIRDKNLSVADAAIHFNIPARTIYKKLSANQTSDRPGGKTILTKAEEELIVHTIILFQQWQCPVTPSTVIFLAKSYMIELDKAISPNSSLRDWFSGFMKRWSNELKLKKTEKLEKVRSKACRKEVVEALWNVDEAGFTDDPGRRSVVIKRTTKHATSSQSSTGKSHTTLLICTSASGEKLPPYVIYQGLRLWTTSIPTNGFPGSRYNCTSSGWIEEPVFYDWLINQFIPNISELWKKHVLKGHCSSGFAKAGIYPFDPRAISKEKLLVPPTSTTMVSPATIAQQTSSDDSIINYSPRQRVNRSASCDHFSNTALNLTTTTLRNEPNNSLSNSTSTPLSVITTTTSCTLTDTSNISQQVATSSTYITSTNTNVTKIIDSSPTSYHQTNSSSSYAPVFTDLTNRIPLKPT
ncbi:unnamed protein product, partial [Rotaria sordida]